MFWIAVVGVGLALTFVRIGALTVLTKVLGLALMAALLLLGGIGLWYVARKLFSRNAS